MRSTLLCTILALLMAMVFSNVAVNAQQIQNTISHQGVLLDTNGDTVEDDTYIFSFSIYADSAGGSALWESDRILTVSDGMFNVQLGREEPLDLPFDQQYWVGVAIDGGSELSPRLPLSSVPYAMHAYTVADSSVTSEKLAAGSVTNEKLAENVEFTNYTRVSLLNQAFVDVSDTWTKLDMGTKTFQKIHDSTRVDLFLHSRATSGSFSGASYIEFQLRIDGSSSFISVTHFLFSSSTTEYITLKAVFEDLSAGEHEVEVWARTDAGTSTNVGMDPGGYRGKIIVTESS